MHYSIRLLDTTAAAELLSVKPCTLERWRWAGRGPTYRKVGRQVRYIETDLLNWLDKQKRQSTSDTGAAA